MDTDAVDDEIDHHSDEMKDTNATTDTKIEEKACDQDKKDDDNAARSA